MTAPSPYAVASPMNAKERLIVALDVPSSDEALAIVDDLRGSVGAFKVGMQLFTAAGPEMVRKIVETGERIFLDLKFHDIPNTVAKAAAEAAKLGVWMLNVHSAGGSEMMKRTREQVDEACRTASIERPLLIGVTVLTSSSQAQLDEISVASTVEEQVLRLAKLTADCGFDGVVASPLETPAIRAAIADPAFVIVTPGIRSAAATNDDQKRVNTFGAAIAAGSSYAVVGRPILEAADKRAAVDALIAEAEETTK